MLIIIKFFFPFSFRLTLCLVWSYPCGPLYVKVAQIAGINAAKQTHNLIPLCHQLLLRKVSVDLTLDDAAHAVNVSATAKTEGQTGVEMEALTAASVAGLTVYDMCKAVSKDIVVSDIRLESKSGGKSADYVRRAAAAAAAAGGGGGGGV